MRAEFHPDAAEEFREAVRYYEQEAAGVGMLFVAEVHRTISFLCEHPHAAPDLGGGIRRKVLDRFPYSVLYAVEADSILVVAVAHQKRRPTYRRGRTRRSGGP